MNAILPFDFPFMILLSEFILTLHYPKRKRWYLAIPFLFVPFLICGFIDLQPWYFGILKFFLIFLSTFFPLALFVKGDVWCYIYVATISYANQHIAQRLAILATLFYPNPPAMLKFLVEFSLMLLTDFTLYLSFVRKTEKNRIPVFDSKGQILIASFVLVITVVLSLISIVKSSSLEDRSLNVVTILFSVLSCFAAIGLEISQTKLKKTQLDNHMLQLILSEYKDQYDASKRSMELINIKCHDLKHLLNNINSKITQEEAETLKRQIEIYDHSFHTGNKALDVVLTEKAIQCDQNGIRFTCLLDGGLFSGMKETDVYSLFENALSNAISSVSGLDEDHKVISITQDYDPVYTKIMVKNYFSGEIAFDSKNMPISRNKGIYHGYGTKSMKFIVEQYHGSVEFHNEDDVFFLTIKLPRTSGL